MPHIKTPSEINWHYETKGEDRALVFIHGWSFDSDIWFRQLDSFSKSYRVITLDLPGHGNSGYKKDTNIVKDLYFIFEELKLSKINLIGHSLGGFLALKFALSYPELINSIILIGTNAKFVKSDDYEYGLSEQEVNKLRGFLTNSYPDILLVFMRWLFTPLEKTVNFNRQSSLTGFTHEPVREPLTSFGFGTVQGFAPRRNPVKEEATPRTRLNLVRGTAVKPWSFTKEERNQTDFREIWDLVSRRKVWPKKEALEEFLSIIEKEDLRKDLKKIDKPTLLISGTEDPICPVQSLEFLNQQIKGSKTELFKNCGHLPFLTQPQRFNKLVKEFLE